MKSTEQRDRGSSELTEALQRSKLSLLAVTVLSALLNILLLGGPLYMMLIYDSVMPSGSIPTLFGLLSLVAVVYIFQAVFDVMRSRILGDVAAALDERIGGSVHDAVARASLRRQGSSGDGLTPVRDLDSIRAFLSGPGPGALIDLPWTLLFLLLLTVLHLWLGIAATTGALLVVGLAVLNDRLSRGPAEAAAEAGANRSLQALDGRRHVEVIRALGMAGRMRERWRHTSSVYNATQDRLARLGASFGGASRTFRLFLQSAVLTVGALLYLAGEASGGIVFAASLLAGRALAPLDQAIANWRSFTSARQGWRRLSALLQDLPDAGRSLTRLPDPCKVLRVQTLSVCPPGMSQIIAEGIDFQLKAGDALGVIGPSGAGKSTFAKTVLGLWETPAGEIRLDGATLDQWDPDELGRSLGYLPQHVELFDGTIAENIARMDDRYRSEDVIAAAQAAGVDTMVLGLPQGYDTLVGIHGLQLSSGQQQRIGLARALYGAPFLVVLDEPNSNLDSEGEVALESAIAGTRARGGIVIIVAHRPAALRQVNKVMLLVGGRMAMFGDRDEVLSQVTQPGTVTQLRPRQQSPVAEGGVPK